MFIYSGFDKLGETANKGLSSSDSVLVSTLLDDTKIILELIEVTFGFGMLMYLCQSVCLCGTSSRPAVSQSVARQSSVNHQSASSKTSVRQQSVSSQSVVSQQSVSSQSAVRQQSNSSQTAVSRQELSQDISQQSVSHHTVGA